MRFLTAAALLLGLGCTATGEPGARANSAGTQGAGLAGMSSGGTGAAGNAAGGAGVATGGAGAPASSAGQSAVPAGCPSDGAPCAVMAVGDSITWGVTDIGVGHGGYRLPLFHLANLDSRLLTFVGSVNDATEQNVSVPATVDGVPFPGLHEGHPGWVIQQISDIIAGAVRTNQPRIVLLMIGTNDMASDFDPPTAPQRLGALLDKIASTDPSVTVVVAQITPSQDDGTNSKIEAYNAAMPALIEARAKAGGHVSLVDMYGAFTSTPDYKTQLLQNTLHPNDAGYAKMADVWYQAIAEMLPRRP